MKEPNGVGCNRYNSGGREGCYLVEVDNNRSKKVFGG